MTISNIYYQIVTFLWGYQIVITKLSPYQIDITKNPPILLNYKLLFIWSTGPTYRQLDRDITHSFCESIAQKEVLYAEPISAWSNQGLLSILNQ